MRRLVPLALALVLAGSSARALDDHAASADANCTAPPALATIGGTLDRVSARIKSGGPLTIVALGSSSTRGIGASDAQFTYPSRLEAELRQRLPGVAVRVLNRGRSGEEIPQMLARLDRDVILEHPDLVIWQLGTNAVLKGDDAATEREPIANGIARIEESGSDVVLMDLQYAPRVVARPGYAAMERVIADAAEQAHIGLFRRFAIMQQWQAAQSDHPSRMIGRDGLHMTDEGYGCLAQDLAQSLSAGWRMRPLQAQSESGRTVAGLAAVRPAGAAPTAGGP